MRKKFGAGVSDHQIALARQEELRARLGPNDAAELQRIAKRSRACVSYSSNRTPNRMADRKERIANTRRRDRALVMSATCLVVMLVLALLALIGLAVLAWPMVP
jgi:type VI protein secretion system component VasF